MSLLTDAPSVNFCNNQIRPFCDVYGKAIQAAMLLDAQWNAKGLSVSIPNDAAVIIADGSQAGALPQPDGRTSITGADVHNVMLDAEALIANVQANQGLIQSQIVKPAVNI